MPSNEHGNPSYLQGGGDKKQEKAIAPVVSGQVSKRKEPLVRRALASDPNDIGQRVLSDVIFPTLKEMIRKGAMTVLDLALYGEVRGDSRSDGSAKSRTAYNSIYDRKREGVATRPMPRTIFNFDDVVFDDRDDAQRVLEGLIDIEYEYGMACVADFYELSGLPTQFTDNKYGWCVEERQGRVVRDDLGGANVMYTRYGYIVNLPKPVLLESN